MAVDIIARMMAMGNSGGSGDSYTKAETDQLLDGKADLVDGKVPASELPSYVDDTVEGYYYQGAFYEDSEHTITITGETGKIYIDLTTNKSYRWTGTVYVRIDECPAFGETQGTIYEGNKGKQNADAIAAIKDGTNIDSFADVETALADKADKSTTYTKPEVDTSQATQDARILSLEQWVENRLEHYGMKWEKENSDPQARCTYLYDCANFTPMQCQNDGSVSMGSWASAFFIRNNYPAMIKPDGTIDYLLDPNDHSKKIDGSPSHVEDHETDNAMAIFDCHIWIKMAEDETYQYIEVANKKLDDDFVDFPYHRADGTVKDKLYYPMFEGSIIDGKLRSLATGAVPQSGTTATEEQAAAQANGTNWSIGDWSHHLWRTLLSMLVSKSTCPEMALGEGRTTGGPPAADMSKCGELKTAGQFYGKPQAVSTTSPVKLFFSENPYGNRWKRLLGMYNVRGTYYIKSSPPYTVDESHDGYEDCGSNPSSNGYVKDLKLTSMGFVPSTVGGSVSTYTGTCYYENDSQINMVIVGGYCNRGADCGFWSLLLNSRPSFYDWSLGASLYLM